MRRAAREATALLRALGHADRLLLLCELSHGERSVSELADALGIRQPTLSQQLGILRAERLVRTRRDGKRVIYALAAPRALVLLRTLDGLFCRPRQTQLIAVKPTVARGAKKLV